MFGVFHKMQSSAAAMAARLTPRRFVKSEQGTVTAFAALIFVLMIGASGIAIDVMRFETQRTQLQSTLDRAVLAAASLSQPYEPDRVVRDYFSIAGIEGYRLDVRVEEGLNFRRVHAYAELEVRSLFMQLFGVRVMSTPAIGAAEERVRRIEVSLVLDISGSMGDNNRIENLRPAARDFVSEVLLANNNVDNDVLVSISIVPYSGTVNAGPVIDSVFTFDDSHNNSTCAHFVASDYTVTGIDPSVPIRRVAHWDLGRENRDRRFVSPWCETDSYRSILPWQHNQTLLHNHINNLRAGGQTSIDTGMNWGVALLDPMAAPAVQSLIAAGTVHSDFADRPAPYIDGDSRTLLDDETIKVVVLMTDGVNTEQNDLHDVWERNGTYFFDDEARPADAQYIGLRRGFSPIFQNTANGRYSIWWEDQGSFWVPSGDPREPAGSWEPVPDGGWVRYGISAAEFAADGPNAFDPGEAGNGTVLSWADLWATYTAEYIAEEWLEVPARNSGLWDFHELVADPSYLYAHEDWTPNPADNNLRAICDAANGAGIVIYTIGFEAPEEAQTIMEYCATTDAHFYDVQGIEISEAFSSIARTINQLRLIQ